MKNIRSISFLIVADILLNVSSYAQGDPKTYLQSLGYSLSSSDLCRGLLDARAGVRASSAAEIGELGYKSDLEALNSAVSTEHNEDVLFSMLTSSQSLGSDTAQGQLRKFCLSKDIGLQMKVANYLQDFGDNSCVESVIELLNSPYSGIRESTLLNLIAIKKQLEPPPASLGPLLLKVIRDDTDTHNVELALQVVHQIGDAKTQTAAETIKQRSR